MTGMPGIGRAFAMKGRFVGLARTIGYAALVPAIHGNDPALAAFAYVFAPAASPYLALQFTGSSTFTSMSGARKELRYSVPIHLAADAIAVALLAARQVGTWSGT